MAVCAALVPLITTLASAGLQAAAAQRAQDEMNAKVRQELLRQKGYQQQAQSTYEQSLGQSTAAKAKEQTAQGASERNAAYQTAQAVPLTASAAAPVANASPIAMAGQQSIGAANTARANYMGQENWQLLQAIKNLQANQELGVTSNLARGSAGVLPVELQQAQHAGDSLAGLGQIIGTLGNLYGMGRMFAQSAGSATAGTVRTLGGGPESYAYGVPSSGGFCKGR